MLRAARAAALLRSELYIGRRPGGRASAAPSLASRVVRGLALQRGLLSHRSALRAGREAKPKPPRAWRAACVTCTQSLALLRDTGRPRGQPEAASHGGKLPGRQPRIAASYIGRPEGRAWAAPSVASRVARAALALSRGKGRPGGQPARSRIMRRYRLRGSPKPRHVAVSCLASQRVIGRPGGLAEAASSLAGRVCTMHARSLALLRDVGRPERPA